MKRSIIVGTICALLVATIAWGVTYTSPRHGVTEFADIVTKGPLADVRAYASFASAITSIGATTTTLLIPESQTVSADVTVPSTMELMFTRNGSLAIDTGDTVTINGPLDAPLSQIFSGSGSVAFGGGYIKEVYPQWWGAVGDGSTDDTTAIQDAIDTISVMPAGTVSFPIGTYKVTSTLTLKTDVNLVGAGRKATKIDYSGTSHVFSDGGAVIANITIRGMEIDGNDNSNGDIINITYSGGTYNNRITLTDLRILAPGLNGIKVKKIHTSQITNTVIGNGGSNGIYFDVDTAAITSFVVDNVWINTFASGDGIHVEGDQHINSLDIRSVYTESITGDGIHIANTGNVNTAIKIDNFTADDITGNGIQIIKDSYVEISSSLFTTISGDAVVFVNGGSLTAINNRFAAVTGDDFDTSGAYATIIGSEPQDSLVYDANSYPPIFVDWNNYAVIAKTADYTILNTDQGLTFTNDGAAGSVNFTLPTIGTRWIGYEVTIMRVVAGQTISITPEASDDIQPQNLGNGIAVHNISNTFGDSITLKAGELGSWFVKSQVGIWGKAPSSLGSPPSFANADTTPPINSSNVWLSGTSIVTIVDFDGGYTGQQITVISKAAVTYDTTSTNLTGSSADLVTASGDVTRWILEDGTTWNLMSNLDASVDNN